MISFAKIRTPLSRQYFEVIFQTRIYFSPPALRPALCKIA